MPMAMIQIAVAFDCGESPRAGTSEVSSGAVMPFSPGETKVLKLFYDRHLQPGDYLEGGEIEALFENRDECQMAVHALANIGYLLLGPEVGMSTPAAALSDWGFDMLEQGGLA
jgi:hypothetical protein